jgi:AraC-like DNA-binding protein
MLSAINPALASKLQLASGVLGQAQARFEITPNQAILRARIRAAELDALCSIEGGEMLPSQLAANYGSAARAWRHWPYHFVRVFETPLPGRYAPTVDTLSAWLNHSGRPAPPALAAIPVAISENRAKSFIYRAQINARLPRLLAGGLIAADFARSSPLLHANVPIGLILGDSWSVNHTLSAGGLAAIGIQTEYIAWKAIIQGQVDDDLDDTSISARDTRIMSAWLDAVTAGAQQVIRLDKGLRLWFARLDELSAEPRQSLAFRKVALFVAARPSATIAEAAQRFKLSRQTATRLFNVATKHAMFRELTNGKSFRRFTAAI